MKSITIEQLHNLLHQGISLEHSLFVYPTDSIYGLGAWVTESNIARIERLKERQPNKHYSLIAPSYARVYEHFQVAEDIADYRQKAYETYGPVTLLCARRDAHFLPQVSSNGLVGIRIVNHPMQQFVETIGVPFLSTSANISGEPYNADLLQDIFADRADFYIMNESSMTNAPSTLINYTTGEIINRAPAK